MAESRDVQPRGVHNMTDLASLGKATGLAIAWVQRLGLSIFSGLGRTGLGLVLVMVLATSACTNSRDGEAPDQTVASTNESNDPGSSTTLASPGDSTTPGSSGSSFGLAGVDPSITNAVAPYDHESNVDSQLLEGYISRLEQLRLLPALNECLAGEGYEPVAPPAELPGRDDPIWVSNWQFPPIETLIAEGFVTPDGYQESAEEDPRNRTAESEAARLAQREARDRCRLQAGAPTTDAEMGLEHRLFSSLRSTWEEVLVGIDDSDDVRDATTKYSQCLRDEGVPAQYTSPVTAFLGFTDATRAAQDGDPQKDAEVQEDFGKLYGRCAQDLFSVKERLRSGELRSAFLAEHEVTIRELASIVGP